jgi:hypothetical protein
MKLLPTIIAYIGVAAALPISETPTLNEPIETKELVHPLAVKVRRAIDYGFSQIIRDLGELPAISILLCYA